MAVEVELFCDVLCPFSLLAARRLREVAACASGPVRVHPRALPLVLDPLVHAAAAGSPEQARELFARRLDDAAELAGGEAFFVGATALREGRLLVPSSVPPLAAIRVCEQLVGAEPASRLLIALASAFLESARDPSEPAVLDDCAREVGVPPAPLLEALASAEPGRRVARDHRRAHALGFRSTPAVLVDGLVRVEGLAAHDEYRELLVARLGALARAAPRPAQNSTPGRAVGSRSGSDSGGPP